MIRPLVVTEFVTLDGVMEAPGGEPTHRHTNWVSDYSAGEHFEYKLQEILEAETLLLGRVTYESFAGAWPTYEGEFADKMNSMPKLVVSSTLRDPAWNNTSVLRGDVVRAVTALKAQEGGPILVTGSKTLVHALLEHDLVDELRLMVFPVTIGSGFRVFPETEKKFAWQAASTRLFPAGVRLDIYRR